MQIAINHKETTSRRGCPQCGGHCWLLHLVENFECVHADCTGVLVRMGMALVDCDEVEDILGVTAVDECAACGATVSI